MAEVYRARDTRFGRDIALKVLNEALAGDAELVQRFEQEARLAGSLNHPNLIAIYDVGIHQGAPYFITELLEGESLRQRLNRGRIAVDTALDWGAQLARGLEAAHARGIIHRDVKPENVFVTSETHVKLLDFGIAKLAEGGRAEGAHGLLEETVTPTGRRTQSGVILGTPAYMSPEQVRGDSVDSRTDIFSLGTVLFEMLSGRQPFRKASVFETGHAILHDELPPLRNVSPALAQLVRRCLAKEPEARIQSARQLAFALELLRANLEPPRLENGRGLLRSWWVIGLLATLAAGTAVIQLLPSSAPRLPVVERVTLRPTSIHLPARFSPDGRVVFTASANGLHELFARQPASPSLEHFGLENVVLAAVSAGNEFAVLKGRPTWRHPALTLARVAAGGRSPEAVAENAISADWSRAGELTIVRRIGSRLAVESPVGKIRFEVSDPEWIENVRLSPGGDLLAFIHHPNSAALSGVATVMDLSGKTRRTSRSWDRVSGLAWATADEIWYSAEGQPNNSIQALPLRGPERSIYTSLNAIVLHDISSDGRALVGQGLLERDITLLYPGAGNRQSLSWIEPDFSVRLARDGNVALVSSWDGSTRVEATLRRLDVAARQPLGEGFGSDLSPDERTALLLSGNTMTVVRSDGAIRRQVLCPDFATISLARFAGGTESAIAIARATWDKDVRLFSVDLQSCAAVSLSAEGLDTDILEVSPGAQWAATRMSVDGNQGVVIVPLFAAEPVTLAGLGPDLMPVGWAGENELWLARVNAGNLSSFGLVRYDVRRRVELESRTIELGVAGALRSVQVTPDGRKVVFSQERDTGHLYIVRGLGGAR